MPNFTKEYVKDFTKDLKDKKPLKVKFLKPLFIFLVVITTLILSLVLSSLLSAVSSNVQISGFKTYFDPQITLTYLVLAYLTGYFQGLTKKQQANLFWFALLLSYTTSFIQGSLTLVLIIPILKKLKLIEATSWQHVRIFVQLSYEYLIHLHC